jgi:phosphatidylglycerol:prolipoprotein diacylglycerol transferase
MQMTHWVHNLSPFLVRFGEDFGIRYYGVAYLLAFAIAYGLLAAYERAGRIKLGAEGRLDLIFALVVGVMVGGRLGYFILYHPGELLNPSVILRVWEGGMSSHGGFAGVLVAGWWFARKNKIPITRLADIVATLAPPGFLLGRVANFINGELWGKTTDVPWAVIFPASAPGVPVHLIEPRHPSQLYQAFAEGLILLIYTQVRFWKAKPPLPNGRLCGEFLVGYAIARVAMEFFREPDAGVSLILGLNRGAFYSLAVFAAGVALILSSGTHRGTRAG